MFLCCKDVASGKRLLTRPEDNVNKKKMIISKAGLTTSYLSHYKLSPALKLRLVSPGIKLSDYGPSEAIIYNLLFHQSKALGWGM